MKISMEEQKLKEQLSEKKREYERKWKKQHPETVKKHYRSYNWKKRQISINGRQFVWDDFLEAIIKQNSKCMICSIRFSSRSEAYVDHHHATGKFRGLLCGECNRGLGAFKDRVKFLYSAINYLERFFRRKV